MKQTVDHILGEPVGVSKARRLITRRTLGAATERANFVATCKMRHKLLDTDICEMDGMWCHVRGGEAVAKFKSVGDAVAAL
jgi:hypothetical protein